MKRPLWILSLVLTTAASSLAQAATQTIDCQGEGVSIKAAFKVASYGASHAQLTAQIEVIRGAIQVSQYRKRTAAQSSLQPQAPSVQIFGGTPHADHAGIQIPLTAVGQRGEISGMVDFQPSFVTTGPYFVPVKCSSDLR